MNSGLYALGLTALVAAPAFAYQLSPTPEAGLWRSEHHVLIGNPSHLPLPDAHRTLPRHGQSEASTTINMECLTPQQTAELFEQNRFQQEIRRKVPECEFTVHPVDRSTLHLQGQCHGTHGFHGNVRGQMDVISSHEFQTTFLGEGRLPADPQDSNSQLRDVSIERNEIFRWSAADCGDVLPRERLSF